MLGGTNSLHTNALDEVLALPGEAAAETALRTQQVIMEETGVLNVADPLGGSWYVEALTDRIEAEAEAIFARIREMSPDGSMTGGILRGIENGWFTGEIAEASFAYQQQLEKGEKKIVGVNCHTGTVGRSRWRSCGSAPRSSASRSRVLAAPPRRPRPARRRRGPGRPGRRRPHRRPNLVPPMLDAARAEATLGEICDALRTEWGAYTEAVRPHRRADPPQRVAPQRWRPGQRRPAGPGRRPADLRPGHVRVLDRIRLASPRVCL